MTSADPRPTAATGAAAWSVWALLLGMGMLMLGNGMQGTLLGLRASAEDFSSTVTGLVMSGYFVGFIVGALLTPAMIRRVGHVRVFAAMASLASVAIVIHALVVVPSVWGAMRILTGFAFAGLYIVTESWLNDRATNTVRGGLLSIYLVISFFAMGAGHLAVNLAPLGGYELFMFNAIILSLALVPIVLSQNDEPDHQAPEPLSLVELYRISPLGTIGAFTTGMSQGAVFGMAAVFASNHGLSVFQVSLFMAIMIAGAGILQWPIGRISDGMDRRRVLIVVGIAVCVVSVIAVPVGNYSATGLIVMGALFGGVVLPLYGLYIAHTNDHLEPGQMVAASSGLYMAVATGAVLGPALTGWLMDLVGPDGFLGYFILLHGAMVVYTMHRMRQSPAPAAATHSPYAPAPGSTGELSEAWVHYYVEGEADDDAPDAAAGNGEQGGEHERNA